jgi:ion channel
MINGRWRVFSEGRPKPGHFGSDDFVEQSIMTPNKLTRNNIILLICLLITVLFYPMLSVHRVIIKDIIFTAIILSGIFSLHFSKKTKKILIASGMVTIILTWLEIFIANDGVKLAAFLSFFCFNVFITVFMIRHVARHKNVTVTILINSINGYLFIGLLGAVLLAMTEILQEFFLHLDGGAINFAGNTSQGFHDYLYFSFVTMTTLGYGDITPVSSLAKSITILIAVMGQLYLTMLVAMLVGKFLSRSEQGR